MLDVASGFFNAIRSDNTFGAGRQTGNSDFQLGQKFGDGVAFVQGGVQMIAGAAGDIGGGFLTATGVGAPAGVPAMAASTAVGLDGVGVAGTAAKNLITTASATNGNEAPGFVVSPGGDAVPVPEGASGPNPVVNDQGKTTGFSYTGGQGGNGLDPKVTDVRVMDPTSPRGSSPGYPNGYATYQNKTGQGVNPQTGKTVPNSDPSRHIPLSPCNSGGTSCP